MTQSRRMLVLRAVVEDYIRSQEPVGSASLAKDHSLGVSSATIRNDMAALEDEGYLEQPHTSAGRIPTEKGYRYFVDRLATVIPLTPAQRRGIKSFLEGAVSLQDTLQRSARLLASITGQVAVVASPALSRSTIRHIEIVPVSSVTVLVVVITDTGSVAQHMIEVGPGLDEDLVTRCGAVINSRCYGLSLMTAARRLRGMQGIHGDAVTEPLFEGVARAFERMADDERSSDLYMAGTSRLAHQRPVTDLAPLFDALEEQVVIMRLMSSLSEGTDARGVGVAIGSETHTPGLLNAAVVTSGYGNASNEGVDRIANDIDDDSQKMHHSKNAAADQYDSASLHGKTAHLDGSDSSPTKDGQGMVDSRDAQIFHASDVADASPKSGDKQTSASHPVAFVGSIGPTHMDYAATMAAVRAVARYLTAFMSYEDGGSDA